MGSLRTGTIAAARAAIHKRLGWNILTVKWTPAGLEIEDQSGTIINTLEMRLSSGGARQWIDARKVFTYTRLH